MPIGAMQHREKSGNYHSQCQDNSSWQRKIQKSAPAIKCPQHLSQIANAIIDIKPSPWQIKRGSGGMQSATLLFSLLLLQQIRPVESSSGRPVMGSGGVRPRVNNTLRDSLTHQIVQPEFSVSHPVYAYIPQHVAHIPALTTKQKPHHHSITKRAQPRVVRPNHVNTEYMDAVDPVKNLNHDPGVTRIIVATENLFEKGKASVDAFYQDYDDFFLSVKALAKFVLNQRIKEKFNIDINPDKVFFVKFNSAYNCGDSYTGWCHKEIPNTNHTLTDYLFTNFSADEREHQVDLNSMSGIYNSSQIATEEFGAKNQVDILPDKFLDLIRDINFYEIAERTYKNIYKRKEMHVKKEFLDFIMSLSIIKPSNDIANDLLAGVGIIKNDDVFATYFDINGYKAANMFVFINTKSFKTILYMPHHQRKFIDFRNLSDMRSWIITNCQHKESRDIISSHFSLKNRQDGSFYDGIDSWLNTFSREIMTHEHGNKICTGLIPIESAGFFETMVISESEKFFDDLDSKIKSNAEVRRDMWEMGVDASNILPNPISPILSLAFHLEHYFDSDTELERETELSKIKFDVINLTLMVVMDKIVNFNPEGYNLINNVKSKLATNIDTDYIDGFLPVERITYTDAIKKFTVPTSHTENIITVTTQVFDAVKSLPVINANEFSAVEANAQGICKFTHVGTNEARMAICIDGKFYHVKPGSFNNAFFLDDGQEIVFIDDTYHLRNPINDNVVKYMPCRSVRSPQGSCIYYSQKLNSLLFKNTNKAEDFSTIGSLRPHAEFPSLFANDKGDMYIKFHDFFFNVSKKSKFFVINAKKEAGFFNKLMGRKSIASFQFSTKNGMMHLTTPEENIVEAIGLSETQADAVYFPVETGWQSVELTDEEREIMRAYGGTGYDAINGFLEQDMQKGLYPKRFENTYVHAIKTIRTALEKIPPYEGVVYRGGMIERDIRASMYPGDLISHKKFLSCSTDEAVAQKFKLQHDASGMMYKIKLTKSGHAISKYTLRYNEAEVMVEDRAVYRVASIQPNMIELEEVTGLPGVERNYIRYIKM